MRRELWIYGFMELWSYGVLEEGVIEEGVTGLGGLFSILMVSCFI